MLLVQLGLSQTACASMGQNQSPNEDQKREATESQDQRLSKILLVDIQLKCSVGLRQT